MYVRPRLNGFTLKQKVICHFLLYQATLESKAILENIDPLFLYFNKYCGLGKFFKYYKPYGYCNFLYFYKYVIKYLLIQIWNDVLPCKDTKYN